MTYRQIPYQQLGITPQMVYQQFGYNDEEPPVIVAEEVLAMMAVVADRTKPEFCFTVLKERPDLKWGRVIDRQLQGAVAYAPFICTAGEEFDRLQDELKNDIVHAYVVDILGSIIAERTADMMEQALQASIDKLHWHHTNRYSPGYCGWSVRQQTNLFALFGKENPCRVRLNEASLMIPEKSVSGIIGLGPEVKHMPYTCHLCDQQDHCSWSRRQ